MLNSESYININQHFQHTAETSLTSDLFLNWRKLLSINKNNNNNPDFKCLPTEVSNRRI